MKKRLAFVRLVLLVLCLGLTLSLDPQLKLSASEYSDDEGAASGFSMVSFTRDHVYQSTRDMEDRLDLFLGDGGKGWILLRKVDQDGTVLSEEKREISYKDSEASPYMLFDAYDIEGVGIFVNYNVTCLYTLEEFDWGKGAARMKSWSELDPANDGKTPPDPPAPTKPAEVRASSEEPSEPAAEESGKLPMPGEVDNAADHQDETKPIETEPSELESNDAGNETEGLGEPERPQEEEANGEVEATPPGIIIQTMPKSPESEEPPTTSEEPAPENPSDTPDITIDIDTDDEPEATGGSTVVVDQPGLVGEGAFVEVEDLTRYFDGIDRLYDQESQSFVLDNKGIFELIPRAQDFETRTLPNGDQLLRFRNQTPFPLTGVTLDYGIPGDDTNDLSFMSFGVSLPGDLCTNIVFPAGSLTPGSVLKSIHLTYIDKFSGFLAISSNVLDQTIQFDSYDGGTLSIYRPMDAEEIDRVATFIKALSISPQSVQLTNTYSTTLDTVILDLRYSDGTEGYFTLDTPLAPGASATIQSGDWIDDIPASVAEARVDAINFVFQGTQDTFPRVVLWPLKWTN